MVGIPVLKTPRLQEQFRPRSSNTAPLRALLGRKEDGDLSPSWAATACLSMWKRMSPPAGLEPCSQTPWKGKGRKSQHLIQAKGSNQETGRKMRQGCLGSSMALGAGMGHRLLSGA